MTASTADAARLPAMLAQLRLPTMARLWLPLTEAADRESWPAARTLAALLEHEIAERAQRRTARHLLEARLPAGKTIDRFDFTAVTSISKARVTALAEGDGWLAQGTNILLFGPPGVGKTNWRRPSRSSTSITCSSSTISPTSRKAKLRPASSSNSSAPDMNGAPC